VVGGKETVTVLASRPWSADSAFLKIEARGAKYDFFVGTRAGEWTRLFADADGTLLSTRVAAGFVGAMLGMYAYRATP
jgi:xylan 1,4-beta-xylosidase